MIIQGEQSPRNVILDALMMARLRATGDPEAREIRRERLADLIVRVTAHGKGPFERPTADDLREALGYPGERYVRDALKEWAAGDPPAGQPGSPPATDAPDRAAKLGETRTW